MAKVRISAVSFRAGQVASFAEFARHVGRLTEEATRATPDFVVFPELFTLELMTMFGDAPLPARDPRNLLRPGRNRPATPGYRQGDSSERP